MTVGRRVVMSEQKENKSCPWCGKQPLETYKDMVTCSTEGCPAEQLNIDRDDWNGYRHINEEQDYHRLNKSLRNELEEIKHINRTAVFNLIKTYLPEGGQ